MNTLILRGNLGGDPIIKNSKGVTYATFSIAVNQGTKDKYTDWFRTVAFGRLAETLKNLGKGDEVLVTGSLHRTTYTKDDVEHRDVEVNARAIEFLRRKKPTGADSAPAEDATPEVPDEAFAGLDIEPPPPTADDCGDSSSDGDFGQEFPDPAAASEPAAPARRRRSWASA
jgi:single stranded DNA-binding protein